MTSHNLSEMLEATIRKYQNRTIEAAQVIAELIELAQQMREGHKRGEKLGLTDEPLDGDRAFCSGGTGRSRRSGSPGAHCAPGAIAAVAAL